ncbi:hypothetical protein J6590_025273 [Homalodisca vitripennis]|nr:hypothetical protein J6590_025273 [Homalodisca vitripennis]
MIAVCSADRHLSMNGRGNRTCMLLQGDLDCESLELHSNVVLFAVLATRLKVPNFIPPSSLHFYTFSYPTHMGPPHGIKQITMFIRENVECLDSSFTTTTTIKATIIFFLKRKIDGKPLQRFKSSDLESLGILDTTCRIGKRSLIGAPAKTENITFLKGGLRSGGESSANWVQTCTMTSLTP